MPIRPLLLQEIQNALGPLITPNITSASAAADVFEAYIWALVIDAAREEGANIAYNNSQNVPVSSFVFRNSPGAIYSSHPYTFAQIDFTDLPILEAHQGIYVAGSSGVFHECDVAVVFANEANTCRQNLVHSRSSKVLLAVECKFYSTNLGIDLARSFLGLTEEISQSDRFFVSNASSDSLKKMLTSHRRAWENGVTPLNARIQDRLRRYFETTFKHFKARYA